MWHSLPLQAGLRVSTHGCMPSVADDLAAMIDSVWEQECAERPTLFNGRVFCADEVRADRIVGHWTEYRRVLTQMRRPELFERLRIRALAVNGLLACADGAVLGRRQADAVYLPGCWQAAPAGNVEARDGDGLDLPAQLLAELDEELGLKGSDITSMRPVAAIEHGDTHIVDIGFLMTTPLTFTAIEGRWSGSGNAEYDALRLVAPQDAAEFLKGAGPALLPSARILIECWRST